MQETFISTNKDRFILINKSVLAFNDNYKDIYVVAKSENDLNILSNLKNLVKSSKIKKSYIINKNFKDNYCIKFYFEKDSVGENIINFEYDKKIGVKHLLSIYKYNIYDNNIHVEWYNEFVNILKAYSYITNSIYDSFDKYMQFFRMFKSDKLLINDKSLDVFKYLNDNFDEKRYNKHKYENKYKKEFESYIKGIKNTLNQTKPKYYGTSNKILNECYLNVSNYYSSGLEIGISLGSTMCYLRPECLYPYIKTLNIYEEVKNKLFIGFVDNY